MSPNGPACPLAGAAKAMVFVSRPALWGVASMANREALELARCLEIELTYGEKCWRLSDGIPLEKRLGYDIVSGSFEEDSNHRRQFPLLCLSLEVFMARRQPTGASMTQRAVLKAVQSLMPPKLVVTAMQTSFVLTATKEGSLVMGPRAPPESAASARQQWRLTPLGHLQSTSTLMVVSVGQAKPAAPATLAEASARAAQWVLGEAGTLHLKANPKLVLDIDGARDEPGARVHLWAAKKTPNQQWRLEAIPDAPMPC